MYMYYVYVNYAREWISINIMIIRTDNSYL